MDEIWYPKAPAVYKCYNGKYIDLEKIVSISEICFEQNPYQPFGSPYRFYIYFQLIEKPVTMSLNRTDYVKEDYMTAMQWEHCQRQNELTEKESNKNYQSVIDVWKRYKDSQSNG